MKSPEAASKTSRPTSDPARQSRTKASMSITMKISAALSSRVPSRTLVSGLGRFCKWEIASRRVSRDERAIVLTVVASQSH